FVTKTALMNPPAGDPKPEIAAVPHRGVGVPLPAVPGPGVTPNRLVPRDRCQPGDRVRYSSSAGTAACPRRVIRNRPSDRLLSAPMRPLVLVPVGALSLPPATDLSVPYQTSLTPAPVPPPFHCPPTASRSTPAPTDAPSAS